MQTVPPATAVIPDPLTSGIRRWRVMFLAACGVITVLAVGGFLVEHSFTQRVFNNGNVSRVASAAHRAAWDAESAIRSYILLADSSAPAREAAARARVDRNLAEFRELTANDPAQQARLMRLDTAIALWDSTFAAPALRTGIATRALAVAGTGAFDGITQLFDEIIAAEYASRVENIDRQRFVRRAALAVLLLSLLFSALAFTRLARELEDAAERAREQHQRAEDQANELEQQAVQLEEQAATLEEQASELEQRLEERDESNRLLERTAAFLDTALEGAPIGIAFFDRDLRFQRINAALARMNGASANDHLGRTLDEMIPALAPTVRPIFERVLRTGATESEVAIEGATQGNSGQVRRWTVTYYPIAAPGRPATGVGCMVLDVTERSLLEEQLRQAQKMEAVGRLAGGIAHDFNNILTIIQSYAELLATDLAEGSQGRSEVDAIRSAADRATALARHLLAFSRRDVLIPRDLDVNDLVRGMEGILRRLLRQGIELELAPQAMPLLVRADAGQLEQVLMNLAINAVDAMPSGGVLRVTTQRTESLPQAEGSRDVPAVAIRVEDTGTGMTKAVQERLFEPFFTTKPAGQGTGLGLATTYAIVRNLGGFIRVHSVPGEGSRLEVFLPISSATQPDPVTKVSPARGIPAARSGETVLLAEDEPAIRMALTRVLRGHGYRVIEASNGGEALRLAGEESGEIHLLLTDVMMPGVGGKELVQRLRGARPTTRVILMSGYTDDELLRAELGDARHVFLQKPFAARQVVAAVRDLLDAV